MRSRSDALRRATLRLTDDAALRFGRSFVCALGAAGVVGRRQGRWVGDQRRRRATTPLADAHRRHDQARALLDQYCVTCHNDRLKTANLSLQGLDLTKVGRPRRAVGEGDPQAARRRDAAAGSAAAAAGRVRRRCATGSRRRSIARRPDAPTPGSVVLHRLNRTEYANAIRDLLDLRIDVTTLLPPDDSANGFDNIAGSLTISPTLLESYATAAARVARMAVGYWKSPTEATYLASSDASQNHRLDGMPFGTRGGIVARHDFPADGEYKFSIQNFGIGSFIPGRAARAHHRRRARARLAVSRRRRWPSA